MKGPIIWLSHPMDSTTPAYGGGDGFKAEVVSAINKGGSANSARWSFPNHLGTHIDAPHHFIDGAATITDIPASAWVFDHPTLVDLPVDDDHLIGAADLEGRVPAECDLLLVRTGFERHRSERRYWERNPGLSAALGTWLRSEHPTVRAIGFDLISVTARQHREEGRAAHRALLDPARGGQPIWPIEDMMLAGVQGPLGRVVVAPLRVSGADGGPCTVFGWPA